MSSNQEDGRWTRLVYGEGLNLFELSDLTGLPLGRFVVGKSLGEPEAIDAVHSLLTRAGRLYTLKPTMRRAFLLAVAAWHELDVESEVDCEAPWELLDAARTIAKLRGARS